ncbi:MAG: hypothetical protein IPL65_09965 [Lewinellaceae bacterium]|nr:hypothetical protein [Lewinellaceae bacterium]
MAKRNVKTELLPSGAAQVTFEFNLENLGNVNLSNIQITDDLAAAFPSTCVPTVMSITSDDYIINPAYNGTSDINLLLPGANGIPVGEKGAVLVTVMVNNCGSAQTSFLNTANASGTAPNGATTTDISDNGSEPDANGNNNANEAGENDPTPVNFAPNPQIGLAKRNVKTELLPSGAAQVTFEFNLENLGNVNLSNIQITDDLAAAFPATCVPTVMSITSDDYIINPAYNGTSDINLLLPGANGIPVGEKGAVLVTVMVNNCGSGQTGFMNTANASGTAPNGATTTDISDNGSEPDANGNNNANEAGENDPTPVNFAPNPQIGLAKRNVKTELLPSGAAQVTFEFNLENLGNVNLSNIQITDDLAAAFPSTCVPTVMSITSDDYIINPAYDGVTDLNLLLPGANGIPVGEKGAVLVTVMVNNCGSGQTGFMNTANASGTAPNGATTTDISDNGSEPDANGNNNANEAGENDPTPVNFAPNPVVGLAKRTVQVQTLPNGSVDVTFEFNIENLGNVNINDLQVVDNLALAFPSTCVISVQSLTSDDYIVNAGFTGIGNNNLLAAGNDIPVGDKGAILLTINLELRSKPIDVPEPGYCERYRTQWYGSDRSFRQWQ